MEAAKKMIRLNMGTEDIRKITQSSPKKIEVLKEKC